MRAFLAASPLVERPGRWVEATERAHVRKAPDGTDNRTLEFAWPILEATHGSEPDEVDLFSAAAAQRRFLTDTGHDSSGEVV